MKRNLIVGMAIFFGLLLAGSVPVPAQNKVLDFKLVNKTGVDIYKVFLSPASSEDWEEDVMGIDVLEDGAAVNMKFDAGEEEVLWDLRVEDSEDMGLVWTGLNLSKVTVLTLKVVDGEPVAEIE